MSSLAFMSHARVRTFPSPSLQVTAPIPHISVPPAYMCTCPIPQMSAPQPTCATARSQIPVPLTYMCKIEMPIPQISLPQPTRANVSLHRFRSPSLQVQRLKMLIIVSPCRTFRAPTLFFSQRTHLNVHILDEKILTRHDMWL